MDKGDVAAKVIQGSFDGGFERFVEAGGYLCYIEEPVDTLVVGPKRLLSDELTERLKDDLSVAKILFTSTVHYGYDTAVHAEKRAKTLRWLHWRLCEKEVLLCNVRSAYAGGVVTVPSLKKGDKVAADLEQFITALPGHVLSCVMYAKDEYSLLVTDTQRLCGARALNRERVIADDDCCNLAIALGLLEQTGDWERFLNSI